MLAILRDRTVLALAALLLVLIICNLAFAHTKGWPRWGWQALSFAGLFVAYRLGGLSLSDIGLSRARMGGGLKYGLLAMVVISVALIVVFLISQHIFQDSRYHQGLGAALTAGLFIVPLKTVLFEELAFRGIMPALLKDLGSHAWVILLVSSVLFGLWHLATVPLSGDITFGNFSSLSIVGVTFLATTVGGAILYLLRYHSGSLFAPMLVHWFINGSAIVLAALAWATSK